MIWRKRSLSVVLFLLFGALSGPAPAAAIPDPLKPLHVISRLGFGSDPGQVEKIETMGVEKYIAAQLAPDSIPQPDKLTRELNELKTLGLNPAQLFQEYGPPRANGRARSCRKPRVRACCAPSKARANCKK